jgi:hypothetical protein
LCGFEAVLAKVTATIDIDFIAGNIRASGDVGVSVGVDVASATIITAAAIIASTSTVPAVSVAAYGVAIVMTDVVIIIIVVGP